MRPMAAKSPWHGSSCQERPRVEDDVGAGRQGLLLPGFRAHVFLPEDHMDLAAQPGQAPGGGGSSVATSQHGYVLVSKEHAVAGGAVGQAPAQEAFRLRKRSQLLFLKFDHPAQGIWKIGVQSLGRADGEFHIWLPVREFLDGNVYFLEASPDVTLTEPANTDDSITVAYYGGADKSVDINSGRGYTRDKRIKPDFAVPGVQILGAGVNGTFVRRSGSSVATGITAGACAMIMEWILNQPIPAGVTTSQVANIIILGAQQNTFSEFPNRQWGYGTMDLYQSLDRLRRL